MAYEESLVALESFPMPQLGLCVVMNASPHNGRGQEGSYRWQNHSSPNHPKSGPSLDIFYDFGSFCPLMYDYKRLGEDCDIHQ